MFEHTHAFPRSFHEYHNNIDDKTHTTPKRHYNHTPNPTRQFFIQRELKNITYKGTEKIARYCDERTESTGPSHYKRLSHRASCINFNAILCAKLHPPARDRLRSFSKRLIYKWKVSLLCALLFRPIRDANVYRVEFPFEPSFLYIKICVAFA